MTKTHVFAKFGIPKCSKIDLQIEFGNIFYTKPHQKTTPDSLVGPELSENLEIKPKSTRKFSRVGGPDPFAWRTKKAIKKTKTDTWLGPLRDP